jgi:ketosteroid isomerase-like protein
MRNKLAALVFSLAFVWPASAQQPSADEAAVRAVVTAFGRSLAAGDSTTALAQLHPDVVIFEGGSWESLEDYRKAHLSADMRFLQGLRQQTARDVVKVAGGMALLTRETNTTGTSGERTIDSIGTETMVLLRTPAGWKIRHIHWSSRRRR